jgi:hypothetical protein
VSGYCPSHDWDRYNDEQERIALDQWRGEVHELAERLFIANPSLMPQTAYTQAFLFISARAEMDNAMDRPYSVKKVAPDDRTWADDLIFMNEDLLP